MAGAIKIGGRFSAPGLFLLLRTFFEEGPFKIGETPSLLFLPRPPLWPHVATLKVYYCYTLVRQNCSIGLPEGE